MRSDIRSFSTILATALCVGSASSLHGQQVPVSQPTPAAMQSLALTVVQGAATFARATLTDGIPLLVDSTALRRTMPAVSPEAVVRAYGETARAVSRASAVTCTKSPIPLACSIAGDGVLVEVRRVDTTSTGASALVTVTTPGRPSSDGRAQLVESGLRIQLLRTGNDWSVASVAVDWMS